MKSFFESSAFIFWAFAFVLSLWAIGFWYSLPFLFWWYDVILHFLGGVAVFLSSQLILRGLRINASGGQFFWANFALTLGIVMFVGVFWEFWEFILDRFILHNGFTYLPGVYEDTLSDLFYDFAGGSIGFMIYNKIYGLPR